jgi:hypothetical protein
MFLSLFKASFTRVKNITQTYNIVVFITSGFFKNISKKRFAFQNDIKCQKRTIITPKNYH